MSKTDPRDVTLTMLGERSPGATLCPSEVARALANAGAKQATTDWRDFMPVVHTAVDDLVAAGLVRLGWKGKPLNERRGPYRIGRIDADEGE